MQVKKIPFILIKMFRLGIDPTYKLKLSFDDWIEYVEKYLALTLNDVKQFTSPQKIVFLHNDFEGDIIDFENELFNLPSAVSFMCRWWVCGPCPFVTCRNDGF